MKNFESTIKLYLDNRAATDAQFAEVYRKQGKSIKDCCKYILGEVYAKATSNAVVMSDEEVFGLAVHYYDEDNIIIRNSPKVVTNSPELSTKEKMALREQAEKEYKAKCIADFQMNEIERKKKLAEKRKQKEGVFTGSLF